MTKTKFWFLKTSLIFISSFLLYITIRTLFLSVFSRDELFAKIDSFIGRTHNILLQFLLRSIVILIILLVLFFFIFSIDLERRKTPAEIEELEKKQRKVRKYYKQSIVKIKNMNISNKNYPDILVPLDIALELKKIGFRNENCLFKFDRFSGLIFFNEKVDKTLDNSSIIISIEDFFKEMTIDEINNYHFHSDFGLLTNVPTWEQALSWFREHNLHSEIWYKIEHYKEEEEGEEKETPFYSYGILNEKAEPLFFDNYFWFYEDARKELVLKLIEIYKNQKK